MTCWMSFQIVRPSKYVPRIEVEEIGSLAVGDMREGVVWSGTIDSDPLNDYAQAQTVASGCVGPAADLWVDGFTSANVHGDLVGGLYVPELDPSQSIIIDEGLTSFNVKDSCPCGIRDTGCSGYWIASPAGSNPRSTGENPFGIISVYHTAGLHGQVIIDAANTTGQQRPASHWTGEVRIGDGTGTPIVLSTSQLQPNQAPLYSRLPTDIGGGAVGLVPFAVHQASSDALQARQDPFNNVLLTSEWNATFLQSTCGDQPVIHDYYGPIKLPTNPLYTDDQHKRICATHEPNLGPHSLRVL